MSKNFITILTLTLITLAAFVFVFLYQTVFESTIPEATQQQIEPLSPDVDLNLIEDLEKSVK